MVLCDGLVEGVREPLLEVLLAAEDVRHEEVHEGPKLHHVVLKRRPCQQQSSLGVESKQGLPPLALEVLNILGLIEDHVIPLLPSECEVILNHQLIRRDAHVKRVLFAPPMPLDLPLLLRAEVCEYLQCRAPLLELHLPIDNNGSGHDNQVRAPDALIAGEGCNHRDCLDGLA